MRTVCFVVLLLAACKDKQEAKPTPAPTAAPATPERKEMPTPEAPKPAEPAAIKPAGGFNTAAEYEAKAFELTDKLADVFGNAGTNCEKLADRLEVFADENKQAFASTQAFEDANPSAEEALDAKMQDKAKGLMQKISVSMQACQKNARVVAALKKLPD